jgi:homoserine O-succinyltransferase
MAAAEYGVGGPAKGSRVTGAGAPIRAARARPLRIGIINIMPRVESYERCLRAPLTRAPWPVQPVWIRLRTHAYSSSDGDRITKLYRTYEDAQARGLNGLILTGAPVEDLEFSDVTYWPELSEILGRANVPTTLGLCWGGLALAKLLGIEKRCYPQKLFGVFQNRRLAAKGQLLGNGGERFWCAQSRHSGIGDDVLECAEKAGIVRLLAHAPETGYTVFETPDHAYVMHLGHPEYEPSRLVEEWERDAKLGRPDVAPPANLDLRAPRNIWYDHRTALFADWLRVAAAG